MPQILPPPSEEAFAVRVDRRRARAPPRARRRRRLPWLSRCVGSAVCIALLAHVAQERSSDPAADPAADPAVTIAPAPSLQAPPPAWQRIAEPLTPYAVDLPALQHLPFAFEARRDAHGVREDVLTFGAFGERGAPHLRLTIERSGEPEPAPPSFFVELTRRAAEAGLAVTRSALPAGLSTKFGLAEAADVALSATGERTCLAFRFADREVGFRFVGWLCGPDGRPVESAELACIIDAIALLDAADDAPLRALFTLAGRRRSASCGTPPHADAARAARIPQARRDASQAAVR